MLRKIYPKAWGPWKSRVCRRTWNRPLFLVAGLGSNKRILLGYQEQMILPKLSPSFSLLGQVDTLDPSDIHDNGVQDAVP